MKILIEHLRKAFALTDDLAQNLAEENLKLSLENLPANTIGEQFWCVIGARESYFKAIANSGWTGFSCSLKNKDSKEDVIQCLLNSSTYGLEFLESNELDDVQTEFLVSLLEHEIQHHGQLIRYVYGNKLVFPKSWNKRYTV